MKPRQNHAIPLFPANRKKEADPMEIKKGNQRERMEKN